jgi:hypothetical protein
MDRDGPVDKQEIPWKTDTISAKDAVVYRDEFRLRRKVFGKLGRRGKAA